ncbi:MAG: hypothetical protein EOO09_17630 [Chitinophagaceae bacterium]|nr:MAG: hypothetical protein EOO09_17630 [Chitinophagaceae bacterium]
MILSRFLFALSLLAFVSCKTAGKTGTASRTLRLSPALLDAHTGISVTDASTGEIVYAFQDNKYFVPASNTKILSCYAVMKYLGDSIPGIRYRIGDDSTLFISGLGDPSFLHRGFPRQRVLDFLKLFPRINWMEQIFDESLGSGWAWDDYLDAYMVQRSPLPMYGNTVRFSLDATGAIASYPAVFSTQLKPGSAAGPAGMRVERDWDRNDFTVLPGDRSSQEIPFNTTMGTMRELLEKATGRPVEMDPFAALPEKDSRVLFSIPVDSLLRPMMFRSDNFFAEQSLMMVSQKMLGRFGITAVIDTVLRTDLRDLPQSPRWEDGSGLSRYNLVSPLDLTTMLRKIIALPRGRERLMAVFPSGGKGTLENYFHAAEPYIYAKTGTLSGVVALSGLIRAKSGRELLFSVLVNNSRAPASEVRAAVETFLLQLRDNY